MSALTQQAHSTKRKQEKRWDKEKTAFFFFNRLTRPTRVSLSAADMIKRNMSGNKSPNSPNIKAIPAPATNELPKIDSD